MAVVTKPLSLSEYDRGIVKVMCNATPWGGGEEGMTARLALENTLSLGALMKRGDKFLIDKLGRKAVAYRLTPMAVELLVSILCGSGGAPIPSVARPSAELVQRIRRQCPRPTQAAAVPVRS